MSKIYDVIIVGGGPAGLSAGLYAGRAKLDTLILEKAKVGGQIVTTDEIENYPGSISDETGPKLIERMVDQINNFGVELRHEEVTGFDFSDKIKVVTTPQENYQAKSVILATGAVPRKLDCPGEKKFTGRGVSYCATCDAAFYEDLEIYVIGGGDTAVEEACYLTKFARKVYVVHRRDELRAAKSIQDKAFANDKIEFIWDSVVKEISGEEGVVDRMVLHNRKTGEDTEILADEDDGIFGVFVLVGYIPETKTFENLITLDEGGYIDAKEDLLTNQEGVFAAGDIRGKVLRQVVTATSDGAIAAIQAEKYIEENFQEVNVVELDRKNFDAEVLEAEGLVLVDFWGQSCEPCKALMPHIHALEEKYGDKIKFAALDISKGRRVAMAQGVAGLPAIYIYKDGVMIDDLRGDDATAAAIEEMIKKHV